MKQTDKALAKARTKDSMTAFSKLCHTVDEKARIVDRSPLIVPLDQLGLGDAREMLAQRENQPGRHQSAPMCGRVAATLAGSQRTRRSGPVAGIEFVEHRSGRIVAVAINASTS